MTKQSKIISKPSRRHLGGITKECKRIEIEKKNYNFTSSKVRKNLLLAFLAVKFQCSNLKLQRRLSSFPYDALGNSPHGFRNNSFARQFVRTNFAGVKKKQM